MFDFRHLYSAILVLFFGIGVACFFIWCTGCSAPNLMPSMDIKTWAGDSVSNSIQRVQDNSDFEMKCSDQKFDEMVCMSYDDLRIIYGTYMKCSQW